MSTDTLSEFEQHYLTTWTEPDADRRRTVTERLWAADGRLVVSSTGESLDGVEAIAAHITQVHDQMIVGNGLRFTYDQHVEAADGLLLRWSMLAPNGNVVGRGVDLVFRNDTGAIQTVYMFMGVN